MIPKVKRYIKHNKKKVTTIAIVVVALIFGIILYKSLFYSSSEKAVYGVRIRDISEHKIDNKEIKEWQENIKKMDGVSDCNIVIKGRLIKFFVTFADNVSTDDIKTKFNDIVKDIKEDYKSYYDITLYAKQSKDGELKYPVTGYKHKSSDTVSYDTF